MFVYDFNQVRILLEVALAMFLGGLIGLDREAAHKPAGLRTHMLISGTAAFLVGMGGLLTETFQRMVGSQQVQTDPVRIVEAIIAGISFLGAGTIIRHRGEGEVEGLTTAASMLFAAAIGIGVALSQGILAIGGTLLVLVTLRLVPVVVRLLPGLSPHPDKEKE
jgi:putative Mg2+ transporter-C (MgtC) family protein